jgi:hypothetical protein
LAIGFLKSKRKREVATVQGTNNERLASCHDG